MVLIIVCVANWFSKEECTVMPLDRRMMMPTVKDEAVVQIIRARLREDMRTGDQMLEVHIIDGTVVIVGYCDTVEQKAVALSIAKGICGVGKVADLIKIRSVVQSI